MSSSDSDDTDILLLIPPDFFSTKAGADVQINNEADSLNSHVVKGIINHINELEDRVSTIETLDSGCTSYYSDSEMNNRHNSGYRNYLYSPGAGGSLNRTPIKYRQNTTCHSTPSHNPSPRNIQQRDNLSKSFSPQRSSNKAYESKNYAKENLLNKIDDLYTEHEVSNTNLNESDNLGTSLDMDISNTVEGTLSNLSTSPPPKECNYGSNNKLDLPTIERMLKQVEATQKEFEDKLKQKEGDFCVKPKKTYSCGSNVQSVPDLNFGLRNFQYENTQISDAQEQVVYKKHATPSEEMANEPKAKRRLDLGAGGDLSPSAEITPGIQQLCKSNYQPQDIAEDAPSIPAKLLSLSELWRQDKDGESPSKSSNNNVLRRKIEEEKYRRQHCEQLIQQLQFRLLEEQEKVAVAMKVDSEKDKAIRTLQSGWAKLVAHWREIEEQRHDLTNRLLNEKQERQNEVTELTKKLERYEREVSQVVNLAAGYKEKAEKAESDKITVQCEAQSALESMRESLVQMEQALTDTRQKMEDYQRDRKMLADKLTLTEDELDKEKLLTKEVKDQLEELKITLKISKDKIETLEKNLDQETKKSIKLEEEIQDARLTCEEVVKKEQKARAEIESLLAKSNMIKSELRDFYQNQLNTNVKEKLKEFQSQLDSAELTLHREFQQKEKTIVENAAKQLKQISEKLLFDFKTKCEVYEAQNKKLKCDLAQRDEKIKEINQMLREESKKRELMAKKVESVMQSQLQQAIHMITSDVTQLHTSKESLASKVSIHRSEQSLLDGNTTDSNVPIPHQQDYTSLPQYPEYTHPNSSLPQYPEFTHPNSAADEMRKYIRMLLEKPQGNPISDFEAEPKESGAGMTSFLESSVTSDIFNEHPYTSGQGKTVQQKSIVSGSQAKSNNKKIWK
uniref:Centrobin n=1 Tax=Cacopsylla melanoneura TaxID=428564 RepID=A0A8D8S8D6_9HEMI